MSFLDCVVGVFGLAGLCNRGRGETGPAAIILKVIFFAVDFISTALDWQVVVSLGWGKFSLVGLDLEESKENKGSLILSALFTLFILLSHAASLRGKWFCLRNDDWGAFIMTEIALYGIEDASVLALYVFTEGLFDPDRFIDRLNVVISNIAGYLVVGIFWLRLLSCSPPMFRGETSRRVPCHAYFLAIWITIQAVLLSVASYVTIFQQTFQEVALEGVDDVLPVDCFIAFAGFGMGAITLFWCIGFLCRWDKCLKWTTPQDDEDEHVASNDSSQNDTDDDEDGEAHGPIGSTKQEIEQTTSTAYSQKHNLRLFVCFWTIILAASAVLGYFLAEEDTSNNEYEWEQVFNDIEPELSGGTSGLALYFGHSIDWEDDGDRNGFGAQLIIGAGDRTPENLTNTVAHVQWASNDGLWYVRPLQDDTFSVVTSNGITRYFSGFCTNETGTHGCAHIYGRTPHFGPVAEAGASVPSIGCGGDRDFYDLTEGATPHPNSRRAAVGFAYANNDIGMVRVYGFYEQIATLGQRAEAVLYHDLFGSFEGEKFGSELSMANNLSSRLAVVSASSAPTVGSGKVTVYEFDDESREWVVLGSPMLGETSNDAFGHSMKMSAFGDCVVVGAPLAGATGSVAVYNLDGNEWQPLSVVSLPDNNETVSHFGYAVAVNDDCSRIEASAETPEASVVFVYDLLGDDWMLAGSPIYGETGTRLDIRTLL